MITTRNPQSGIGNYLDSYIRPLGRRWVGQHWPETDYCRALIGTRGWGLRDKALASVVYGVRINVERVTLKPTVNLCVRAFRA